MQRLGDVIRAVAMATDPTLDLSIAGRREMLLRAVAKVLNADVWLWFSGEYNQQLNGDSMVTHYVGGGFKDDHEKAEFFRIIVHPDLTAMATTPISRALATGASIACRRSDLVEDSVYYGSPLEVLWTGFGFNDFIIFAQPQGEYAYSAVGLHRRVGAGRYTVEDVEMVKTVFGNVAWLHDAVPVVEASATVLQLSPRERQVLMFLIAGDNRKQVALKTKLSEHTVTDYIKAIYKKFGVSSRAELLAKFIQGETPN